MNWKRVQKIKIGTLFEINEFLILADNGEMNLMVWYDGGGSDHLNYKTIWLGIKITPSPLTTNYASNLPSPFIIHSPTNSLHQPDCT